MKRPLLTWLVFAACTLTGLGVLGWFSLEMIRLERGAAQAREIAAREENVRLALWRMDSALASIHGLETSRPVDDYSPFVPAVSSFTADLQHRVADGVVIPSPLLGFTPPFVRLHVQIGEDGTTTSPQVPEGPAALAALRAEVSLDTIQEAAARLQRLRSTGVPTGLLAALDAPAGTLARRNEDAPVETGARADFSAPAPAAAGLAEPVQQLAPQAERQATVELKKSQVEQEKRAILADDNYYNQNRPATQRSRVVAAPSDTIPADLSESNAPVAVAPPLVGAVGGESVAEADALVGGIAEVAAKDAGAAPETLAASARGQVPAAPAPPGDTRAPEPAAFSSRLEPAAEVAAEEETLARADAVSTGLVPGPLQVHWIEGELFLLRRVEGDARRRAQAVWLDWPELRAWLLSRVTDLLPEASLEPVPGEIAVSAGDASRRLAFLPVRLLPGTLAPVAAAPSSWSPVQTSLGLAWALAAVGVVALALLLAGTLRLSERRGAFVSAVTHELRTPLTTFRMYTEMLAGGMVPDPAKRAGYLDTLRKEAERLSHLVENVLSYARLERGRASRRVEDTTPGALLARIEERLRLRAEQGGLGLALAFEPGAGELPLRTDTTAFEQIVFNLVDNAAKYARRPGDGGTLTISVAPGARGRVIVRVADDGPGIAPGVRRRLFQPFSKSAAEAAHSQPGVGLGLALSRRLARDELHGELSLERTGPEGTVFRLEV